MKKPDCCQTILEAIKQTDNAINWYSYGERVISLLEDRKTLIKALVECPNCKHQEAYENQDPKKNR